MNARPEDFEAAEAIYEMLSDGQFPTNDIASFIAQVRQSAFLAGARAMQRAAAKVADEEADKANEYYDRGLGGEDGQDRNAARYRLAVRLGHSIRQLDPTILKEQGDE